MSITSPSLKNRDGKKSKMVIYIMGMDFSGFLHHKRLSMMVRCDGDPGERHGRLSRMS